MQISTKGNGNLVRVNCTCYTVLVLEKYMHIFMSQDTSHQRQSTFDTTHVANVKMIARQNG